MKSWRQLRRELESAAAGGRLLVGLDFDGTLAPFAPKPELARLPGPTREMLRRLVRNDACDVAILSGRSLSDVRAKAGIPGLHFAGNHGLELGGRGTRWEHPAARAAAPEVRAVARRLGRSLAGLKGVILQDKRLSLSVHYRLAGRTLAGPLEATIRRCLPRPSRLRLFGGHEVWELRPRVRWNKGDALLEMAERLGGDRALVLIGDDATDEEAFKTLGRRALCVRVGAGSTRARFRLDGPEAVRRVLDVLSRLNSR